MDRRIGQLRILCSFILFAFPCLLYAKDPWDTHWTETYGGTGSEYCNQVIETNDKGFIFAGLNGSQGGIFPWLVKTDTNGSVVWENVYSEATTNTEFFSVQQTFDGGYIAGGKSRANWNTSRIDYYLVRTDSSGKTLWSKTYTTPGYGFDYGKSIKQTFDGGFIFGGDTAPGPSPYECFLVRTDASGNTIWANTYGDGGSGNERANSVIQTSDCSFIMAGYTDSYGAGSWDFYLVKVDPSGNLIWTRTYGGSNGEEAFCIQETSDHGLIIAGYTQSYGAGLQDFYVVRTDETGKVLWEKTYGGPKDDYAKCVKETRDGGFIIVGSTASHGAGFTDCYVVKIDSLGNPLWTSTYGGIDDERAYSVGLTWDGGYIVGGHTSTFGAGNYDAWLLRLVGERLLEQDVEEISAAIGGTVNFTLNAGIDHANRTYILLGSISGTDPGTLLPKGKVTLPLNWDIFTALVINLLNTPIFSNFMGTLDGTGSASAKLDTIAPIPGAAGLTMHFAYSLNNPWNFVSNPVAIEIVP